MRVRCPVSQSDMLHISSNCRTPEKMALTLLDYLFHREVQAVSNLSGQGKHGKKQLDPLMIYGIRCEYPTHKVIHISKNTAADFYTARFKESKIIKTATLSSAFIAFLLTLFLFVSVRCLFVSQCCQILNPDWLEG